MSSSRDVRTNKLWRSLLMGYCSRMVKKFIFASKGGEFTRPKAHAASRS
jgi:hypothetical protein